MRKNNKIPNFLNAKTEDNRPIPHLYENLYLSFESNTTPYYGLNLIKNQENSKYNEINEENE
jgi:hypothetical protein